MIQFTLRSLDKMTDPSAMVLFGEGPELVITKSDYLPGERPASMIDTGPIPAIREPEYDERLALLDRMGARLGDRFSRYHFPTADAVIDPGRGCLFIACDPEPEPADWNAVVGLIRAVGWSDGSLPHRRDPGEPDVDPFSGVCTWRLEYVGGQFDRDCPWCDGKGESYGCPLCERMC